MNKRYIALKKRYHTDLLVHFILIDPQILELLTSAQHYLPQIWSYYGMYNIIPYQIMKVSMLLCSEYIQYPCTCQLHHSMIKEIFNY
jgi:hypothetical protein